MSDQAKKDSSRDIALVLFVLTNTYAIASLASWVWMVPFAIFTPDFYRTSLSTDGGSYISFLIAVWIYFGAFKAVVIAYNDRNKRKVNFYFTKLILVSPVLPLFATNLRRPFFPPEVMKKWQCNETPLPADCNLRLPTYFGLAGSPRNQR